MCGAKSEERWIARYGSEELEKDVVQYGFGLQLYLSNCQIFKTCVDNKN
jgi:hypothetical protein